MPEGLIRVEPGRVVRIFLSNPPLNLISLELITRLRDVLLRIGEGRSARAVVLASQVPAVFSAGADVRQLARLGTHAADERLMVEKLVWRQLAELPLPTIAAIDGAALGGGLELALCCDLRVATHESRLGLPEPRLGIIPSGGGTQRLTRLVGPAAAKELIFLGEPVDADHAMRIGLVNRVVPAGRAFPEALAMGRTIADRAPMAVREAKRLVNAAPDLALDAGLALELAASERLFGTTDSREGFDAFLTKRTPRFRGR